MAMQMGMIGLGRMGAAMVRRLMRGGHGGHLESAPQLDAGTSSRGHA